MRTVNQWLREPLLHFLLLGALLFGLHTVIKNPSMDSERGSQIKVSASDIDRLREGWTRERGSPPAEERLQGLIDEYVREEVLYREALALGLDRGDVIVRRRLVQKMQFISQDLALLAEPIDNELGAYFEDNHEQYRIPPRVAFSHIYFNQDQLGDAAEQNLRSILADLQADANPPLRAPERGDPFMLQDYYPAQSQSEVEQLFGFGFARELFGLKPGSWQGPVESSYGLHLVRVLERIESRLPELVEVRDQVRRDLKTARLDDANEKMYAKLRNHYEVVVDVPAIAQ